MSFKFFPLIFSPVIVLEVHEKNTNFKMDFEAVVWEILSTLIKLRMQKSTIRFRSTAKTHKGALSVIDWPQRSPEP